MIMKRYVLILIAGVSLAACNTKELEEKIAQLEQEKQEAMIDVQDRDANLMSFMQSFAEIEKNLREIREREMNIELSRESDLSSEDLKNKINEDIQEINRLLTENRETIQKLAVKLKNSNNENVKLNNMMTQLQTELTAQIEQREGQIATLNEELKQMEVKVEELNTNVASLEQTNQEKEETITEKVNELNTAYYVAGSLKTLREDQIVDKEGGFLGLGKTKVLKDDFNHDKFNKIDIRETVFFPVDGEEVKLVTTHPSGSYAIEKDEENDKVNLVISNPEKFWESSKYLVMEVK
jgi:myosin heavy subunit